MRWAHHRINVTNRTELIKENAASTIFIEVKLIISVESVGKLL